MSVLETAADIFRRANVTTLVNCGFFGPYQAINEILDADGDLQERLTHDMPGLCDNIVNLTPLRSKFTFSQDRVTARHNSVCPRKTVGGQSVTKCSAPTAELNKAGSSEQGGEWLPASQRRTECKLQLNPECVAKLQAEHDAILGSDPSLAAEKIREAPHILDSLQYTLGVIKETLRMNPATITIREGRPSFSLKINGEDEPWPTDGFDLFDSSITIHHDPANFVDPLKFMPDRFSALEGDRLHPAKNIWRGFQLGPRKCIGQELAVVVLKLVLAFTVRSFDIEMA
ncbi:hypothetical protein CBS147332_6884 [Penicillium roqueforti]|nr:hypothetical protein CBS147332_6884 [Penicillium roqueforti]KAI3118467.1 hypothetical protein CBS147331_3406 [Penicillium roqueforti]